MIADYRNIFVRTTYVMTDLVCAYTALFLACALRPKTLPIDPTFFTYLIDSKNPFPLVFVFWIMTTILFTNANGLYRTRREVLEGIEIGLVIKSVLLSSLVLVVALFILKIHGFPRTVFGIGAGLMIVFFSVWRLLKRKLVEYLVVRGYNNVNAIIIGAGKVGQALQYEIEKMPTLGIKVAGFLDDFQESDSEKNIKVLGKIADFKRIAKKEFIHKVFITIHNDHTVFLQLLEEAKKLGAAVRVVPQGFELTSACDFTKYNVGIIPVLEYGEASPLKAQVGKRLFDFIMSLIGIIVLLPVFILIGVCIKLDSRGPVFYVSRRYGRGGHIFPMIKFRSMSIDADQRLDEIREKNEVSGPIFKIKKDPRVTTMGKILRKYSLDELPQIINVFLGHMSLVGPRPLPIDQIEREDLNQLKRLEVRPGITGLWQIRGRSDISFDRLVKWDTWYINNWSLWLDWNILLQTVPVVLKGKGAY